MILILVLNKVIFYNSNENICSLLNYDENEMVKLVYRFSESFHNPDTYTIPNKYRNYSGILMKL